MKPRNRKFNGKYRTDYLRTITDENGDVLMDDIIPFPRSTGETRYHRMKDVGAVRYSDGLGKNRDKRYYWCMHRIGGPAIIIEIQNYIEWYVNGVYYMSTIKYCEACSFSEETTLIWALKYGESLPFRLDEYLSYTS